MIIQIVITKIFNFVAKCHFCFKFQVIEIQHHINYFRSLHTQNKLTSQSLKQNKATQIKTHINHT